MRWTFYTLFRAAFKWPNKIICPPFEMQAIVWNSSYCKTKTQRNPIEKRIKISGKNKNVFNQHIVCNVNFSKTTFVEEKMQTLCGQRYLFQLIWSLDSHIASKSVCIKRCRKPQTTKKYGKLLTFRVWKSIRNPNPGRCRAFIIHLDFEFVFECIIPWSLFSVSPGIRIRDLRNSFSANVVGQYVCGFAYRDLFANNRQNHNPNAYHKCKNEARHQHWPADVSYVEPHLRLFQFRIFGLFPLRFVYEIIRCPFSTRK